MCVRERERERNRDRERERQGDRDREEYGVWYKKKKGVIGERQREWKGLFPFLHCSVLQSDLL